MVLVCTILKVFIVISYKVWQLAIQYLSSLLAVRISKCCSHLELKHVAQWCPWLKLPTAWQLVLCLWVVATAIVSHCANHKATCTIETRKLVSHQGELRHIVSSKCKYWEGVKEMPWGWPIFWILQWKDAKNECFCCCNQLKIVYKRNRPNGILDSRPCT